jgi:GWxTD domain-containing protein
MRPHRWTAVLAMSFVAASLNAQTPVGAERITAAAVADSLTVLARVDSSLRLQRKDAPTWFRRGMLAWALYERSRVQPPVPGLDSTSLLQMADSSLRLALHHDAGNPLYMLTVGRLLLSADNVPTPMTAYGYFDDALIAARASGNPRVHAEAAVAAGRVHWRRYDLYAYRYTGITTNGDCGLAVDMVSVVARRGGEGVPASMAAANSRCSRSIGMKGGFPGEVDYTYAEQYLREAFDALPSFSRAYREFAMLLGERNRWKELEIATNARLKVDSADAWAWLNLGLAIHRQGAHSNRARLAFERGMTLLPPAEVSRLDRLERVLKPADTARYLKLDERAHTDLQRLYWNVADPLWAREGNEPHIEFLARVTYAELRWSVEEANARGADTDRGDVYIRYGPPDFMFASRGSGYPCELAPGAPFPTWVVTNWVYYMQPPDRLTPPFSFTFCGQPMYGTAQVPPPIQQDFGEIIAATPVTWNNIRTIAVDSMPVQAVRFRGGADSVDVLVATSPPVAAIKRIAEITGNVRSDYWLLAGGTRMVVHDTLLALNPGVQQFTHRVPSGTYVYRAEASADGARYAGRASGAILAGADPRTGFALSGFGISDPLMATSVGSSGLARRWRDVAAVPLVGPAQRKANLALVWENYELANDGGTAKYNVAITIERVRSTAGRIAAQVVGNIGGAIGVDRSDERVIIKFDRTVGHSPVIVDQVMLALGDTPAGGYRVTIAVTDLATRRVTSRTLGLVIVE